MTTFDRMLSITLRVLLVAVLTLAVLFFIEKSLERYERVECRAWTVEVQEHEHLRVNIAEWQVDQCETVGVPLPVLP